MDNLIKCPFCKSSYAAAQLVSHCKECPQRRSSGGRTTQSIQQPSAPLINAETKKQTPELQKYEQPAQLSGSPQQQQQQKLQKPQKIRPSNDEQIDESIDLIECPVCSRKFTKDRLEKHEKICEKSANRKVKVFDAADKRFGELDNESKRLVQKVEIKKVMEKKKGVNDKFTVINDSETKHFGDGDVAMFGDKKPNFKPFSDEEEIEKKVVKTNKTNKIDILVPADATVEDVELVPTGGPKLPRTPTSQQLPYSSFSPEQVQEVQHKQLVPLKVDNSNIKSPSKDKKHKHKHKHKSKNNQSDMMQTMQQMFQQMQVMQQQQQQQIFQPQYQPQFMHSMPLQQQLPQAQFPVQPVFASIDSKQVAFCFSCGSRYIQEARFCAGCGAKKPE
ncbi:hypothetical protein SS50377_20296 [Spironucleus salmonicida]|uniref:C2HC/C3H-type domain-containing protein n=1 Tax=Spironucleus salmonicida TaxID=348837 RepID=V6LL43_9EUKA|nr:hypothetical protein SS50377_20296 [Spironucleus salmonicida]|eukprot:EST45350.1 hypothetical protein SS50377_14930 [Spironucleus salmonicida]